MRPGACPGPLQIETSFAIPDTTQASFRDDKALPQDCVATDPNFPHFAPARVMNGAILHHRLCSDLPK
jgi:hypothetical protein